jgi:hypothetical protein
MQTVKPCDLRFDTPPVLLADALLEAGWTIQDLLHWQQLLLVCFLEAGGWDQLDEAVPVADSWELVLLRQDAP